MQVLTFASPAALVESSRAVRGRQAVIIDTLRATSVMLTALRHGARAILPVAEVEDALQFRRTLEQVLLCGERGGEIIPGFDMGNSPFEYTKEAVEGQTLVMTTTNGTRAVLATQGASVRMIGAMINAPAVAQVLSERGGDVTIVCAGTAGLFTREDALTAGAILHDLSQCRRVELDDLGQVCVELYEQAVARPGGLAADLLHCTHAQRLKGLGFERDIEYCMQHGSVPDVAYYDGSIMTLCPPKA